MSARVRTDWTMLIAVAVSALAHGAIAVGSLRLAGAWDGEAASAGRDAGLVYDREALVSIPMVAPAPRPKPEPAPPPKPPLPELTPPQAPELPEPPEITLGRDDSDAVTPTWIGAAPKDASEASGDRSTVEQGAYALPAGEAQPRPPAASSPGDPGEPPAPAGTEQMALTPTAPVAELDEPRPLGAGEATERPVAAKPASPPAQAVPAPRSNEETPPAPKAGAPEALALHGDDPDAKDDEPRPSQDAAELLKSAQKLITEAAALLATSESGIGKKPTEGQTDAAAPAERDPADSEAKDDRSQERKEAQAEKIERKREGLGDAKEDAPNLPPAPQRGAPPTETTASEQGEAPSELDADLKEMESAATGSPRALEAMVEASPDPPAPQARPAAPATAGQDPIPVGIVIESVSGEVSDRESVAASIKQATRVEPGQPVAGNGVTVKTIRPRWSHFTILTATPQNAVVRIEFSREGKVVHVELLRSSGRSDVDRPLLDAVYQWSASGKRLTDLPPLRPDGQPTTVRMTFEIILGR